MNTGYTIRIVWTMCNVLSRLCLYSLLWSVCGGMILSCIFIPISTVIYIMIWRCFGLTDDENRGVIFGCLYYFFYHFIGTSWVEYAHIPVVNCKYLFVPVLYVVLENFVGLGIIFVFASFDFDCVICANSRVRQFDNFLCLHGCFSTCSFATIIQLIAFGFVKNKVLYRGIEKLAETTDEQTAVIIINQKSVSSRSDSPGSPDFGDVSV